MSILSIPPQYLCEQILIKIQNSYHGINIFRIVSHNENWTALNFNQYTTTIYFHMNNSMLIRLTILEELHNQNVILKVMFDCHNIKQSYW